MTDCLIVGGGVIGLSLAYELAGHGLRVRVIDAGRPGREASWAGAGILPPASPDVDDPLEQLTALSNALHAEWSQILRTTTSIDNGFRRCGAIYLARDAVETRQLENLAALMHQRKLAVRPVDREALAELEPALRPSGTLEAAYLVPDECQLRNPRHLKALVSGCLARGVEISSGLAAEDFDVRHGRVEGVRTGVGRLEADVVCLTSGAWTASLARRLDMTPAIEPVRGQMVLLSLPTATLSRIVNEGSRYLVPRGDGRVLVGSTEEKVGFDRGTTALAAGELLRFAFSLAPELEAAQIEQNWAGLRPSTRDGKPYLGRAPGLENVYVAAGHFRSGLQLSTGTAVVISQLIRGQKPSIDLTAFRLDRDLADTPQSDRSRRARRQVPLG